MVEQTIERIEGKIAAILDYTTVVINRGSEHGVEEGDKFYIYADIGPITDPDTGEKLGSTQQVWGAVTVTLVERRFSVAETGWIGGLQNLLTAGQGTRIELPLAEQPKQRGLMKIRVGSPVVAEKRPRSSFQEDSPQFESMGDKAG